MLGRLDIPRLTGEIVRRVFLSASLIGSPAVLLAQSASPGRPPRLDHLDPLSRVSVASDGAQGDAGSLGATISADGRFIAFRSMARNLAPLDTNGFDFDVFVHDRRFGATTCVSVNAFGERGNDDSGEAVLSHDGRFVCFGSLADNLIPIDTNGVRDAFVYDTARKALTRISIGSAGQEGNGNSGHPSISADGRYVAFHSSSTNFSPLDTNGATDVFVHDRSTGLTTQVSVSSEKEPANSTSRYPFISADGRFVAFESFASNLVPRDTNIAPDAFVHDRLSGATIRVSVSSSGSQANGGSLNPFLSSNGRFISFRSAASNLVLEDRNGLPDIFVHDRVRGTTAIVSLGPGGVQANDSSFLSSVSSDGRYVAFESLGTNLAPPDTNETFDVFLHDRRRGTTVRASVSARGEEGHSDSLEPAISADGRWLAFTSFSNNLIPNDTNTGGDIFVRMLRP
jgi:Tol biopolymer transport system component